ncbi:MAG: hypothetical protein R3250_04085, partial [Melioribacteraceae bacterium]|nr:hypothetical protein [Melioribacteraceae bacterium]
KRENIANVSILFIIALIFPLGGLLALLVIQKRQDKLAGNQSLLKYQKAEKNAKNLLKLANKSLDSNDLSGYYNNLSSGLFGYLGDKLKIQNAEFTLDKALTRLNEIGIDADLINKIKKVSEKCEFARFAPNAVGRDDNKEIFNNVDNIINEIAAALKQKMVK